MTKELQDHVWSILPKEFKEEVNEIYLNAVVRHPCGYNYKTDLLKYLFGIHNLTSDAEGEELLTCEKYKVEEALNYCDELDSISGSNNMLNWGKQMIVYLFGSKCLLDAREFNFARSEPKPAEPKNEDTSQEQCVPKNAESGTHSFNRTLKDGFHDHNRLYIAAMAMQGILSNSDRMKGYEHVATTPPCEELTVVVARNALRYADELLRQSGKGGSK